MDTGKSTFCYSYIFAGGTNAWKNGKQTIIEAFTMEAKFVTCFEVVVQAKRL